MAPEVLKRESYDVQADVFSFGIVVCEMVTGKYPYEDDRSSINTFEQAIIQGLRPQIPADCPECLRALINECWADDPAARPSVDHIVEILVDLKNSMVSQAILSWTSSHEPSLGQSNVNTLQELETLREENKLLRSAIDQLSKELQASKALCAQLKMPV